LVVGYETIFYIQLRDEFGNNVTKEVVPADHFIFTLTPMMSGMSEPKYNASITFRDDAGVYEVDYVTRQSGKFEVSVNITGEGELGGLPASVFWAPDKTYPPYCEVANIDGSTWNKAVVKSTNEFLLIAKDQFKNRRLVGGDEVDVRLTADSVDPVVGTVDDKKDGTYVVSYFLHDKAEYTLDIKINGTAVGPTNAPLKIDAQYANNPVPTLLIVACVLGGGIVLAVAGFFIYRRYNRLKYELLE